MALEGLMLGAKGWVSGLTSAFPQESVALVAAAARGDWVKARAIYRWFMPLLHLDAEHDLVQSIKLAEQIMGHASSASARTPLTGARRAEVTAMVEKGCRHAANACQEGCLRAHCLQYSLIPALVTGIQRAQALGRERLFKIMLSLTAPTHRGWIPVTNTGMWVEDITAPAPARRSGPGPG
ncbi:Hypothetical protein NGAL_HAMBI1146_20460 [Neorhizobium galegae bv. officinalis]|nr:Hypothetical protein NGAL_HAMBI490_18250 [Neorhizobium galegae bv. officinalis]CDZ36824.1 Hypothetical protein NGAL_HAMBI1146_20460 [Neorhizobium galegae bv. officinalis]